MREIVFNSELPTEANRESIMRDLCYRYDILEKTVLSKSLVGRDITALHIGNKKNAILFTAAYHGMEWLTSLLLLKFTYDLCEKIKNEFKYLELIEQRGVTIVPCVNPDGVEISLTGANAAGKYKSIVESIGDVEHWQANARGVDINHNFNAGWEELHEREKKSGITCPSRTRFGGECPESEPETQTITNLCRSRHFEYALALHSQGEEIYWDYGRKTPPISKQIADEMAKLSGYTVSTPEDLAVGGGFKDWFIDKMESPAFTIEVGKGKNPLPICNLDSIYDKTKDIYFFLLEFTGK